MRRLHHLLAAAAAGGLLVSLSGVWWTITLPSGGSFGVTGLEVSALGSTLLGAVAAAYGASLLIRGIPRKILGALHAGLAAAVGWAWTEGLSSPLVSSLAEITAATGIAGQGAVDGVDVTAPTGFGVLGFIAVASAVGSGLVGIFAPEPPKKTSRYERRGEDSTAEDPVSTWDSLSEGDDPTKH